MSRTIHFSDVLTSIAPHLGAAEEAMLDKLLADNPDHDTLGRLFLTIALYGDPESDYKSQPETFSTQQ